MVTSSAVPPFPSLAAGTFDLRQLLLALFCGPATGKPASVGTRSGLPEGETLQPFHVCTLCFVSSPSSQKQIATALVAVAIPSCLTCWDHKMSSGLDSHRRLFGFLICRFPDRTTLKSRRCSSGKCMRLVPNQSRSNREPLSPIRC